MTAVSTEPEAYWGIGGEYGPFPIQTTGEWAGWPDFGKVMHYFLKKSGLSIEEFAEIYGRRVKRDQTPMSKRQVEHMIYENKVPDTMSRRKIIADLLDIPPTLFGLAVLEDVTIQPHPELADARQNVLPRVTIDTTKYQSNIRTFLALHATSHAQDASGQINTDIQALESLVSQTVGDLQYHIQEILFSYHSLATKMASDQRDFKLSHLHANQAVRVAKAMKDIDLIATAFYKRGRTYLDWGRYGVTKRGVFQIQIEEINKAIRDFENAKLMDTKKILHPQIKGLIDIHLGLAYAIRSASTGEKIPALAITMLDNAEEYADKHPIHDPFERELITGSQGGFVKGEYYNTKIRGLILMGMPGAALKERSHLASLRQGAIGKHFTRNQIWQDLIAADVLIALEQFEEATRLATNSLAGSLDIKSPSSIRYIADIHGRLLQSDYGNNVQELGDMLHEASEIDY